MALPYITTESGLQALVGNKSYSVDSGHPHYDELFQAILSNDSDTFLELFSKENMITRKFDNTSVVVQNGEVLYNGKPVHGVIVDRILGFCEKDLDPGPLVRFLENLMQNPSARAVNELYSFLEHRKLPLTDDGCFIAYKTVNQDYTDKYSKTLDNSPGQVVEFVRNQVDDQRERTCSFGLHVGALEYAGPGGAYNSPGDKVVIVKVNPRDAVSVPADHSAQKLRVCRYEVLSDYETELSDYYYEEPSDDSDDEDGLEDKEFYMQQAEAGMYSNPPADESCDIDNCFVCGSDNCDDEDTSDDDDADDDYNFDACLECQETDCDGDMCWTCGHYFCSTDGQLCTEDKCDYTDE